MMASTWWKKRSRRGREDCVEGCRFYLVEYPSDSVETLFTQNYKSNVFDVANMCCDVLLDNVVFVSSDSFQGFEDDDFYDSQHLIPAGKVKMKTYIEQMIDVI